jgi:hypothetical protein
MPLRGANQTVAPQTPFLKAADVDFVAGSFRPCIRVDKRPVVLDLILEECSFELLLPMERLVHQPLKLRFPPQVCSRGSRTK